MRFLRYFHVMTSMLSGNPDARRPFTAFTAILQFSLLVIALAMNGRAAGATNKHDYHLHRIQYHKVPASVHSVHEVVMKSSCANTQYPELCMSSLSDPYADAGSMTCEKDVIFASLNVTASAVEQSYLYVQKLAVKRKNLSPRAMAAHHDCRLLMGKTMTELELTVKKLSAYLTNHGNKSVADHACDLKILLSGAMTNQQACVNGFSLVKAHGPTRKRIKEGARHAYRMASNSLAMVTSMTNLDVANESEKLGGRHRKLLSSRFSFEVAGGFPNWLSAGDRKLLQDTGNVAANIVVAADGSGDVMTVSEAINRAPEGSSNRFVIRIKGGVYSENVEVPPTKTNIMLIGDGTGVTVITGSRSVMGGSTTFNSATFGVMGDGFVARDITFQNTAGPSSGQAVALRVGSDFSAFYRCDISGYQDTLYAYSMRQFYRDCTITGTVDFIFGNAAAVFQNCNIMARRPLVGQNNDITAQSRSDPNQNTGFSIQGCRIDGTTELLDGGAGSSVKTYLGRPWMAYSRVVVLKSTISNVIDPAGWDKWVGTFGQDTSYYGEYMNDGPGAATQNRVEWKAFRILSDSEAQSFSLANFVGGGNWVGSTGLPFSLDL